MPQSLTVPISPNGEYDLSSRRTITDDIVFPKTAAKGIKLDTASPSFGWKDMIGQLKTRAGAANPTDAIYVGTMRNLQFAVNDEVTINFHIPHDYVPGSDIFLHPHWSHTATTVTGGSLTWGYEMIYAKGHNQAAFPGTSVSGTFTSPASITQRQHIITDYQISAASPSASQIDSDELEPDGILIVRFYLSANNITVSGGGVPAPFVHFVDIHYQTTNLPTKQRAPNFYV